LIQGLKSQFAALSPGTLRRSAGGYDLFMIRQGLLRKIIDEEHRD
jgi:hypothetical protein